MCSGFGGLAVTSVISLRFRQGVALIKMSSWGCPHEIEGACQKVNQLPCDPGMRGCVLYGRFVFSNPAKNRPARPNPGDPAEANGDDPSSAE